MTQAEDRVPLQTTDTAAQFLNHEIRKFVNLLPGKDDEAAKRFLTIAMQVLSQKPDLLRKCGRVSVLNCLIECARLRLDPEGALGHAYLIPYGRECTVQIGYKGFCQLVYRQDIKKVWTDAVFPEDEFEIISGDRPRLHHTINIDATEDRENDLDAILGAYACIILPSGQTDVEWMNLFSIKKTRGKSSAWEEWPIEMAKIRPLKRLLKRQKTTDTTLPAGMALDDRDGTPRDPKLEVEAEVAEVWTEGGKVLDLTDKKPQDSGIKTGKDLIPGAVQDALSAEETSGACLSFRCQNKPDNTGYCSEHSAGHRVLTPEETAPDDHATHVAAAAEMDKEAEPVVGVESRKDINARIENAWYDFHKADIPDDCLDMDRELKDYCDPEITSDAEAWKFADLLARALLVAGVHYR